MARELLSYFLSRNDSHSSHDVIVKKRCGNWDNNGGTPKRPARHVISLTQLCLCGVRSSACCFFVFFFFSHDAVDNVVEL